MNLIVAMRVFARVATHGSISAAARHSGMSTSAVSRHVIELENELDVRLLNRTTRKLHLTEAGTAYLTRVRMILDDVDELRNLTRDLHQAPHGTLRLSATHSFAHSYLVSHIPTFLLRYPEVSIDLELSNRRVDVIDEGYDMVLRFGSLPDSNLAARRVGTFRMIACASPDYCRAHGVPQKPEDLEQHACVLDAGGGQWKFSNEGETRSVAVRGRFKVNSYFAVREAVIHGLGIAILPSIDVRNDIKSGVLVQVLEQFAFPEQPLSAVFPHRKHLSAKVGVFLDFLSRELKSSNLD